MLLALGLAEELGRPPQALGRLPAGLLNQDRVPSSSGFYCALKRWYPIQQAGYSRVGALPLVNLRERPNQQPILSTRNSMKCGPSRTLRIPPLGRKIPLLHSLPELLLQVAKAGRPVPTSPRPLPCAKESKAMVQEERREGMTAEEGHTEAEGEDDGKVSPDRSGATTVTPRPPETGGLLPPLQCSPEPPNLLPGHPEDNFSEKAQVSRTKPSSQSPAMCSDGTAGDGRPPSQPGPLAAVLSAPSPCCSLLPERPVEVVLGEDHQPGSPELLMSGKALQREPPSDTPQRSSSPLGAAGSRRPCKRTMPPPLSLSLPPLLPPLPPPLPLPLPLPWGRSDLPPPPKLPGMTRAKTRCTRKQNMDRQRNRILKDARKAMRCRSAAPPAPGTTGTTGSMPPVSLLQVPPTTTDLANLSSRFPSLAGLPPSMDPVARHTAPVDSHSASPADSLPSVSNPIVGITLKKDAGCRLSRALIWRSCCCLSRALIWVSGCRLPRALIWRSCCRHPRALIWRSCCRLPRALIWVSGCRLPRALIWRSCCRLPRALIWVSGCHLPRALIWVSGCRLPWALIWVSGCRLPRALIWRSCCRLPRALIWVSGCRLPRALIWVSGCRLPRALIWVSGCRLPRALIWVSGCRLPRALIWVSGCRLPRALIWVSGCRLPRALIWRSCCRLPRALIWRSCCRLPRALIWVSGCRLPWALIWVSGCRLPRALVWRSCCRLARALVWRSCCRLPRALVWRSCCRLPRALVWRSCCRLPRALVWRSCCRLARALVWCSCCRLARALVWRSGCRPPHSCVACRELSCSSFTE
ncbi:unnamed protein product [Rangifer tarandus platyrhynchus]|uniref:Uncharacterized protein n=1 Tax=Rangifer tarandus platyrhynchus TaxID=3082113 RepID=A0ABN8XNW9_RANTA|nr:unnamed protein product [Rangifer tarandus platyrhynchus]